MSAIKHALNKLDSSLRKLEGSMNGLEKQMAGKQRDMFAAAPPSNQNTHGANSQILTQRLDRAIEKVETILKESAN